MRLGIRPCATEPIAVTLSVSGPGVATVSPPMRGHLKARTSAPRPSAKAGKPFIAPIGGQREGEQKSEGPSGLGRKIGEVDPERLAGDCPRRIVGEEMDAGDERIRGQHEVFAGQRTHQRRIIAKLQAGRPGEGGEIASDEIGFAEARRHGKRQSGWGAPMTGRECWSVSAFGGRCRVKPCGRWAIHSKSGAFLLTDCFR